VGDVDARVSDAHTARGGRDARRVMRRPFARRAWRAALLATSVAVAACGGRVAAVPTAPVALSAREQLTRDLDSLLSAPAFANAHWGVLVVHPETGDTLYARNADKLFVPASNQKLITGAVTLAQLGPEFRIRTALLATGPVQNGVLKGDLVLVGRGDPSWSDAVQGDALLPLRDLADSVRGRGIREITGRVVVATGHFAGPKVGFGWDYDDLEFAYGAPVDAVLLNEGIARIVVQGAARAGEPADVRVLPVAQAAAVLVQLQPTRATADTTAPLDVAWDDEARAYVVRGSVTVGQTIAARVAMRDPARTTAHAFAQALTAVRVNIGGGVHVEPSRAALVGDTLAVLMSPPLADVLRYFEKPSQNQIGEQLLRVLGLEKTGVGHADSGLVVMRRQLAQWQVDSTRAVVRDGSGLSRHNFVSPRAITRVLDAMQRQPTFGIFRDALPTAGVDGTLASRMRNTTAQGNVSAKTGYVDRVRSLSGYVKTLNGETLVFSALANNWTTPVREIERVQDFLAVRLASLRYVRPGDGARPAPAR
jgi:D-alanyl-D-alanine carboxypeptidase/D-alanyl-D-alanine-endopeptidase (penicillin-binding protein 4)